MIYMIEKLWIDYSKNKYSESHGYEPIGYVTSEQEAIKICGNVAVMGTGWPFNIDSLIPKFKYKAIEKTNFETEMFRQHLEETLNPNTETITLSYESINKILDLYEENNGE